MNKKIITVSVIVVLVLIAGFVLMTKSQTTTDKSGTITQADTTSKLTSDQSQGESISPIANPSDETSATSNVKELMVEGSNFKFAPNQLKVKTGDHVKITFKNTAGMHDFRIDDLGIATKVLRTGGQETIEFTADKAGSFEYYCSVGDHKAMGMKGMLVVE